MAAHFPGPVNEQGKEVLRADMHRQELTCHKMSLPGQKQCYKEYRLMKRVLHYSMDGSFGESIVGRESESPFGAPVLESGQARLCHDGDAVHCCRGSWSPCGLEPPEGSALASADGSMWLRVAEARWPL